MRAVSILSFLGIAAVVCIGIAIASNDDIIVSGSGTMATDTRSVRDFHAIDVSGAMNVNVCAGAEYHVEIQGDDNIVKYVETKVEDGTLEIGMRDGFIYNNGKMRATIVLPCIDGIEVSGACTVNAQDVKSPSFKVDISGASHVNIAGESEKLECELSGACTLAANGLKASSVDIDCSGASTAHVYAAKCLSADVSGASRVKYSGSPTIVKNETSGGSSIEQE
jgi:hypothetical protein